MKHLSTLLLFTAMFYSTSAFTQSNQVTLGLFYFPNCEYGAEYASVEYFRSIKGGHSFGVKSKLVMDAMETPKTEPREYIVSADLVHRWTRRSKTGPSRWHFDAGLSVRSRIEKFPAHQIIECAVGMSEEDLREWTSYNSSSHTKVNIRPGFATAATWEYPVSRHFSLGFEVMANMYLSSKEAPEFLAMPSVNASYRF